MQQAIVVDLDSTLCNIDHRLHYIKKTPKDWKGFFKEILKDRVNIWCEEILNKFKRDYVIILCTGRPERLRNITEEWLMIHRVPYHILLMKQGEEHGKDNEAKEKLYLKKIKPKYDVLFVLEDRKQCVDKWRELGLVCLQCNKGDF